MQYLLLLLLVTIVLYFLFIYLKNIIRYEVMKDNFHKILRKTEPTFLGNILSELWPKKRDSMALHDMTSLNYIYINIFW